MSTNIPPAGPGNNTSIQPPENDQDKEDLNKAAEDKHRPQTNVGKRLAGRSLAARAGGIKQMNDNTGSIMRQKNNPDQSEGQEQTSGDGDN